MYRNRRVYTYIYIYNWSYYIRRYELIAQDDL